MSLDYPGGPNEIARVLIRERQGVQTPRGDVMKKTERERGRVRTMVLALR